MEAHKDQKNRTVLGRLKDRDAERILRLFRYSRTEIAHHEGRPGGGLPPKSQDD